MVLEPVKIDKYLLSSYIPFNLSIYWQLSQRFPFSSHHSHTIPLQK